MRILVIRRDNIGDLVCTTPLFAVLRRRYPDGHLAALVNSYNAAVLAGNPDVDAVHAYTKLKHREPGQGAFSVLLDRVLLMGRLRRERFDCVVLAKSEFDRYGLKTARRLRVPRIIGMAPRDGVAPRALTQPLPPPASADLHEVEVMMQLGAALDVREPAGPVRVFPAPERVAAWRSRFPALAGGKRWIALHISARVRHRLWPVEKFVELARILAQQGLGVVLLWAPGAQNDPRHPGDDERAAAIATGVGPDVTLIPAQTGRLDELIAVLSLCRAFIGIDGGAMHLAAGLGLPIVGLFEGVASQQRHWHPWQVPHEVVAPPGRVMAEVAVDQVVQAWTRLSARLT
jgi:ADP-heptose:LPS heptosyltransferase